MHYCTETIFQDDDSGLFFPALIFGPSRYIHDEAQEFCKLNNGSFVKIDSGAKIFEIVEFVHSVFPNVTRELGNEARSFWLVNLQSINVSHPDSYIKYMAMAL